MKRINFLAVLFTALLLSTNLIAQTIVNGNFENATASGHPNNALNWDRGCSQNYGSGGWFQGTSDLYGPNSMPAQNRVNPRIPGTNYFAGMIGPKSSNIQGIPLLRMESVINQVVNGPFVANREYTVSFYAARAYFGAIGQQTNIKMEALLRVYGDCTQEKLIPININVPIQNFGEGANATNNWTQLTATFTLTNAEEAQQFDAIEIRPKYEGVDFTVAHIFVDDLSLTYRDVSTADIIPATQVNYTTEDSYYGEIQIANFCENEIFVDGSGSENEVNYYITVKEWDLNTWQPNGVSYTTPTITGTVPSNIDLEAVIGATLNTGVFYQASIIVGNDWNADWLYFTVVECCPDELEFQIDCEEGTISVINLPQGSNVNSTTWIKKKKITGNGSVLISGQENISTIQAQGSGFYTATMSITLANGTECIVTGITFYSEEDCCSITHPNGLEAWIDPSVTTLPDPALVYSPDFGYIEVPVICDRDVIINTSVCGSVDGYSMTNSQFDVYNWTDIGNTLYSNAGSGTLPSPIYLISGEYVVGAVNNFSVYVSDPNLTPQNQSTNVLFIVGGEEDCGSIDVRLIGEATPLNESLELNLAPNPAANYTTVNLNKTTSGTVSIYSMDGREMFTISFEDEREIKLSTVDLPNGIYVVKLNADNKTIVEKLIKE